jgi:hypothetical protein
MSINHIFVEKELDFDAAEKRLSVFCEKAHSMNEMMNLLG